MNITLNGETTTTRAGTVAELVAAEDRHEHEPVDAGSLGGLDEGATVHGRDFVGPRLSVGVDVRLF